MMEKMGFFLSTQTAGFILYYKTKQTNKKKMVGALPAFTVSSTCLQVVMSELGCIQGEIRPVVMC